MPECLYHCKDEIHWKVAVQNNNNGYFSVLFLQPFHMKNGVDMELGKSTD